MESAEFKTRIDALRLVPARVRFISFEPLLGPIGDVDLFDIHWAIVGGESGPRSRPMESDWVADILRQSQEQDVAFFFKQWGGTNKKAAGRSFRRRTWDEYPDAGASAAE